MLKRLHPLAGLLAMLTILLFWLATIWSEAFGTLVDIVAVKTSIPWGLLVLVPALALTGASGFRLGGFKLAGGSDDPRIRAKQRRMKFIAGNGILILVPCALYLATLAGRAEFGTLFYGVQAVELLAGATNLALMSLNLRDGLRLTGRLDA
ncbi:hypothetical protein [Dongia mobilis]|jgi:hypothetical protein|uniref:hypothetical protein n=1 Tax=Dongia sp. TaxID=1977262 RepID=UPI0026F253FC